ncbi:MAG: hypothetical protein ACI4L8_12085 [Candidatus Fimadaptatus sp.]
MEISGVFYGDAHQIYELNYVPDIVFAQRPSGALTLQLNCRRPARAQAQFHCLDSAQFT